MGKLPNGVFGPLIGTAGALTGYVLNGQNIVKALPHPSNKPRSKGQKTNAQRMTIVNEFCKYLSPLLTVGFRVAAKNTTKNFYNIAVSYNKKYATKGEFPNVEIDYPNVMIGMGKLLPAINPKAERVSEGIKFSWDQADGSDANRHNDQVFLLVHGRRSKWNRYIRYGVERSEGSTIIHINGNMMDEPMKTYISFVNDDRTAVATSIYTGRIG
jgi:hypothetical protein